jgi:hypothetical protein
MKKSFAATAILLLLITGLVCTACSKGGGGTKSKEWKNAMETYKKFLTKDSVSWITEDIVMDESMKFMIKDINEDGRPELFLRAPYRDVCWCESYTVVSDGIMEMTAFDEFNGYYPGTGVFSYKTYENDHMLDQGGFTWFYFMDDAAKYSAWDEYSRALGVGYIKNAYPEIERTAQYYWGGILTEENQDTYSEDIKNPISEDEFNTNLKELIGDTKLESITEEWLPNTEENRNTYLK